jgi:hypothetical protein
MPSKLWKLVIDTAKLSLHGVDGSHGRTRTYNPLVDS